MHIPHQLSRLLLNAFQWLFLTQVVISSCPHSQDFELKWNDTPLDERSGSLPLLKGEWWEIDCSVNDNRVNATLHQTQIWGKPFRKQRVVDGNHVAMKDKNVFRMPKLQLDDTGKYYCHVCGKKKFVGGIIVRKGNPFAVPTITKTPDKTLYFSGDNVSLECSVKNSYWDYDIKWFKFISQGNFQLLKSVSTPKDMVQRNVLDISKLKREDEGLYMCEVRRYAVHHVANKTVEVKVHDSSFAALHDDNDKTGKNSKVDEIAIWRYATIFVGVLLMLTLFFLRREKQRKAKMALDSQGIMKTDV